MRVIKLDFDTPYEFARELVNWVTQVLQKLEIPYTRIYVLSSHSGNVHMIVELGVDVDEYTAAVIEVLTGSDPRRVYPNLRRAFGQYPGHYSLLFDGYAKKPVKLELVQYDWFFIEQLWFAVKHI